MAEAKSIRFKVVVGVVLVVCLLLLAPYFGVKFPGNRYVGDDDSITPHPAGRNSSIDLEPEDKLDDTAPRKFTPKDDNTSLAEIEDLIGKRR